MDSADYSLHRKWPPRRSLRLSDTGQTRNSTATSGTTVYNPPLITEVSPDSMKLESVASLKSTERFTLPARMKDDHGV